jgi:hypothetical protein
LSKTKQCRVSWRTRRRQGVGGKGRKDAETGREQSDLEESPAVAEPLL